MPFYIYNAAPGPMYFRGNEIKAEAGQWTEVSPVSVDYGTFNTMRRLNHIYLVETPAKPTYNPNHPDNRARVEADAPGAKQAFADSGKDSSMSEAEMKAFLVKKNSGVVDSVDEFGPKELAGNTEKFSFADLDNLGTDPVANTSTEPLDVVAPAEGPSEAVKPAKAAKTKAAKANVVPATEVSAAVDLGPEASGNWS